MSPTIFQILTIARRQFSINNGNLAGSVRHFRYIPNRMIDSSGEAYETVKALQRMRRKNPTPAPRLYCFSKFEGYYDAHV